MAERRAILRLSGPDIREDQVAVASRGLTIGRLAANDLQLENSKISRHHARFEFTPEGLTVQDLGSSNGTVVRGERIPPNQPVLLQVGDTVQMGPFTLRFEQIVEASAEPERAAPAAPPSPPASAGPISFQPPPPTATDIARPNGGHPEHLEGIPRDASNWMQYLPSVYSDDAFMGRFLLIFESLFAPLEWIVDNFAYYLDPRQTPAEWLQWFGRWADILVPGHLPRARQQAIVEEMGELFLARGTRKALSRHLELVFGQQPEILEPKERPYTFTVRLSLGKDGNTRANQDLARRIIEAQRPAYTNYTLEIV